MRCENVFFCALGARAGEIKAFNEWKRFAKLHTISLGACCVCVRVCVCEWMRARVFVLSILRCSLYFLIVFRLVLFSRSSFHSVLFVRLVRFFCSYSSVAAFFYGLSFFFSVCVFVPLWVFCRLLPIQFSGLYSVYTNWRNIEIMFHVSTLLPYEKHDPQKLQRKRHIGNDIVCVVFLEADNTPFSPACIKSHFLHTFILVRPLASPASQIKMTLDLEQVRVSARIRRKPTRYEISLVTRDEVGAFKPYLWEQSVFEKGPMFR